MDNVHNTVHACVVRIGSKRQREVLAPFMSALLELTLKYASLRPTQDLMARTALGKLRADRKDGLYEAYDTYIESPEWIVHYHASSAASSAHRAIEMGVPEDQVRALIALHLT